VLPRLDLAVVELSIDLERKRGDRLRDFADGGEDGDEPERFGNGNPLAGGAGRASKSIDEPPGGVTETREVRRTELGSAQEAIYETDVLPLTKADVASTVRIPPTISDTAGESIQTPATMAASPARNARAAEASAIHRGYRLDGEHAAVVVHRAD